MDMPKIPKEKLLELVKGWSAEAEICQKFMGYREAALKDMTPSADPELDRLRTEVLQALLYVEKAKLRRGEYCRKVLELDKK